MQTNQINLQGRVAVVTGGASGIGARIASRFAASGAKVCVWDRVAVGDGGVAVDVASEASIRAGLAQTAKQFGHVDILVCSAGISGYNKPAIEYEVSEWQRVLDINLTGVFMCNKIVSAHMVERGYGRIVNIASIAGKEGNPNAIAYSASKAGVIALTKSIGKELATKGVSVNAVAPAVIRTPILEQCTQAHIDFMLSKIPMGRAGEVDEVAALVAWLASEECSFSTGATYDISGGRATY
jgi:2-dehydro-3-deoxy-L-rhamnonate dehydrogenase (NAD+)